MDANSDNEISNAVKLMTLRFDWKQRSMFKTAPLYHLTLNCS